MKKKKPRRRRVICDRCKTKFSYKPIFDEDNRRWCSDCSPRFYGAKTIKQDKPFDWEIKKITLKE